MLFVEIAEALRSTSIPASGRTPSLSSGTISSTVISIVAAPLAHLPLDQDHRVVGDQMAELLELVGEEGDGDAAVQVLQHEAAHEAAGVGAALDLHPVEAADDAAQGDRALGSLLEVGGGVGDQPLELGLVLGERIAGEIEAERLLLVAQPLALRPGGRRRGRARGSMAVAPAPPPPPRSAKRLPCPSSRSLRRLWP